MRQSIRGGKRASLLAGAALSSVLAAGPGHAAPIGAAIEVNQVGFLPAAQKLALVPTAGSSGAAKFAVLDAASGKRVFEGKLGPAGEWDAAGESIRTADFSTFKQPGSYRLAVDGLPDSAPFRIAADAYRALDAAAIRAYFLARSGIALDAAHAGPYARPAGHPDDKVLVHESAASAKRPAGTVISSPKGWYDAGDYNKYIVNSGISTYTLLAAYEQFPQWFGKLALNLPESGNKLPDLLNEALWNIEWMSTMQDPDDGGVYHKLTNKTFDPFVMPDKATTPRYVVQKTTAAALDFAAVMATASRVLAPFDAEQPGRSKRYLAQAESAWRWAQQHPDVLYKQPADIKTGEYGDTHVDDEFSWAAAELLIATGKPEYRAAALQDIAGRKSEPDWAEVRPLGWYSLAAHRAALPKGVDAAFAGKRILAAADTLAARWQASPARLTMAKNDFIWGSNAVLMNQAMLLVQAYRLQPKAQYLRAAQSALDYVLGRNPLGISYVTGFGANPVMHPHHRPSDADGVKDPVPGWLAGGPNPGQQDKAACAEAAYPSTLPALSYTDTTCAYAANEVAINWNAPLVYVAAALQELER
jgi:endoglucanase